ncbi:MAG: type III pantothenate kinase [Alphaproteobacteria bacterium GM7ARS4]|nr:type III pantothenate kinase [Alphaproteobacteria bacterium GM7ARS4]
MFLAIDVGNSDGHCGLFREDGALVKTWRWSVRKACQKDEYSVMMTGFLSTVGCGLGDIEGVIIASVVPSVERPLSDFCRDDVGCLPCYVSYKMAGVPVLAVDHPSMVGADRLANAKALVEAGRLPALAIDCGTATTFDVVDGEGHYRGGAIAPGFGVSMHALVGSTALLSPVSFEGCGMPPVVGRNTEDALRSGLYWGYIGLIEGILRRVRQHYSDLLVVGCGGYGDFLTHACSGLIERYDAHLTLRGLCHLYKAQTDTKT